jgi:hypothetical protein
MSRKAHEARQRAIDERGAYLTEVNIESIRTKLGERLTPARRERFRKETARAITLARATQQDNADAFAKKHERVIRKLQEQGMGLTEVARQLTADGHTSPRGGPWTPQTVRQVLKRLKPKTGRLSSEVLGNFPIVQKTIQTGKPSRMIGWKS